MKKFRLIIKPTDEPEEIKSAEKFLKSLGYEVERVEEEKKDET